MKAEIKQQWVDALRSGKYKQGRQYLHHRGDNTWCCLGVLCDIVKQPVYEEQDSVSPVIFDFSAGTMQNKSAFIVPKGWQDLSADQIGKLWRFNDGAVPRFQPRVSFADIADWIEINIQAHA